MHDNRLQKLRRLIFRGMEYSNRIFVDELFVERA